MLNHGKGIYLVAARRTPIGSFGGALSSVTGSELGAQVIKGVMAAASVVQMLHPLLRELNRKHDDDRSHDRGRGR